MGGGRRQAWWDECFHGQCTGSNQTRDSKASQQMLQSYEDKTVECAWDVWQCHSNEEALLYDFKRQCTTSDTFSV
jgi:hypothetical protein